MRHFSIELEELNQKLLQMGGLVESAIHRSVRALLEQDRELAEEVIRDEPKINRMEMEIDGLVTRLLALRQPVAQDLRRTVAAMKIASNLERIGDLAKNIAKRGVVLAEAEPITPLTRSIERMGRLVSGRLRDVLDAYTASEVQRAVAVWSRDDEVDEHYNSLFRELLTYMMGDPRTITACAHLLFIAKNLERIGDHATNIAEIIHYEITGEDMPAERPKGDALRKTAEGAGA